jgi:hypothetical protein
MSLKESEIQDVIMQYLTLKRVGSFERINNLPAYDEKLKCYRRPSRYAKKGVCDIIGCVGGRFIGIEVKSIAGFKTVGALYKRIDGKIDQYQPKTKMEEHLLDQIKYITDKNKNGAYCFFTYGLDHTIEKLKKIGV